MSRKYLKTTKQTNVGTYRMYRDSEDSTTKRNAVNDRDVVHVELLVAEGIGNIPSTNTSRRLYVGYMKQAKVKHTSGAIWDFWVCLRINPQDLKIDYAADTEKVWAGRTQDAFHGFICYHSPNITQALLDSEGEVFNPITNEKRSPYPLNNVEPLQETWIRISDDEDALARIWNDEFKKLAGAVVPVKEWDNHDKTHRRPQHNIWAVIDREHTAPLGMTTGVGLPPRLWEIIDIDKEEEGERMSHFEVGKTYKNWPHGNATCKVIEVLPCNIEIGLDAQVRVEIENSNGNIVKRWATVKPRSHMDTDSILIDVEPFYMPCFNACDVVEVDA